MQELELTYTEAQLNVINKETFEQGIKDVVAKYQGYTVTAGTIKEDKQVLADLRKLLKQISDRRIEIKKDFTKPLTEFEDYLKTTIEPVNDIINGIAQSVKEFEDHQKAVRVDTVRSYLANKCAEYQLDPRIFDDKSLEYTKAGDFMADGFTLKKVTMKSLDDMVAFEYQNQQEKEKAKAAISGQCAEYGMTDQPYIRMLQSMSLADVTQQIMADYLFEKQKAEMRKAEEEREQLLATQRAKEQEQAQISTESRLIDPETGEILESGQLPQNDIEALRGAENGSKQYKQKMTLEVYFESADEKERFKATLAQAGFEYKKNYQVSGYQNIKPLSQEELAEQCGW